MAQVRHDYFQFGAEATYQKNRPPVMIKAKSLLIDGQAGHRIS